MTPDNYDEPGGGHKQPVADTKRREMITIPHAHAIAERPKSIDCDLGDGLHHWIAKSQIAPQSEVQHLGDRGTLIIPRWLAQRAGLMKFVEASGPRAREPHTRSLLKVS